MKNINSQQFKTEFKKLSQLDRVEFRQRISMNESRMRNPLFYISKYYLIGGLALMLYSILIAPSYGDALFFKFFEIGGNALKIGVLFFCLEYGVFIYILWKSAKEQKEIVKEYMPKLYGDKK
jgi:hypothetical protein